MYQPLFAILLLWTSSQTTSDTDAIVRDVKGCVVRVPDGGRLALADIKKGTFELTGANVDAYVGKRVELKGKSRSLTISGGLYPSANVAAQAGADPLTLTFAAVGSGATRDTAPPPAVRPGLEFRVEKIRTLKGICP